MIVVHGATNVRRNRGMAASREITTTGLLWISGSSHHQSSPRSGIEVTRRRHQYETLQGFPTHRIHQLGIRRTRRKRSQPHLRDCERQVRRALRRGASRHLRLNAAAGPSPRDHRQPLCLLVPCSCHNCSMLMPASRAENAGSIPIARPSPDHRPTIARSIARSKQEIPFVTVRTHCGNRIQLRHCSPPISSVVRRSLSQHCRRTVANDARNVCTTCHTASRGDTLVGLKIVWSQEAASAILMLG